MCNFIEGYRNEKVPQAPEWTSSSCLVKPWSGAKEKLRVRRLTEVTPRENWEPRNRALYILKARVDWYVYITEAAAVKG